MAGHSKFANIKHKKEKNDAIKGKIFTIIGREIAVAVKAGGADPTSNSRLRDAIAKAKSNNMPNDTIERSIKKAAGKREIAVAVKAGGADPTSNSRLRDAIAKAKSNNMPNDTIERSIKKAAGNIDGVSYETIVYEGYGPKGVAIIVETLTDNKNRTAANVRSAFTKGSGNMGTTGCVSFMFDKKGQIMVEKSDSIDSDELMMIALDAGALDFNEEEEGYEIITSPEDFSAVREAISQANILIADAEVNMIPQTYTSLTDEDDVKKMMKLLDLLDADDDVKNVYHNWEQE